MSAALSVPENLDRPQGIKGASLGLTSLSSANTPAPHITHSQMDSIFTIFGFAPVDARIEDVQVDTIDEDGPGGPGTNCVVA